MWESAIMYMKGSMDKAFYLPSEIATRESGGLSFFLGNGAFRPFHRMGGLFCRGAFVRY